MTSEDIINMWNQEAPISESASRTLGAQAREIPSMHAKYLSIWREARKNRDSITHALNSMLAKYKEFLKNSNDDDAQKYGWEIPERKIMKTEINDYAETLPAIRNLRSQLFEADIKLDIVGEILKQINNRNWYIQSAIRDRDFLHGK